MGRQRDSGKWERKRKRRGRRAKRSINWESDSNENNWIKCHNQEIICIAYGFFIESNQIHLCHELVFNASLPLDGVCVCVLCFSFSLSLYSIYSVIVDLFFLLSLSTVLCALFFTGIEDCWCVVFFFCFIQCYFSLFVCAYLYVYMFIFIIYSGYRLHRIDFQCLVVFLPVP